MSVNRAPGALCVHCLGLALPDLGRNPCTSESWRARKNYFFKTFCEVNNA